MLVMEEDMLWLSKWSMMLLTIMCSITLQEIQVRETGR